MATASASERKPWTLETGQRVFGLEIVLLKTSYVLPWSQFLYAVGTSEEVRAVFTTHDVLVKGSGLDSLLSDFAAQRVGMLREPARTEKFASGTGPRITELAVRTAEESRKAE